MLAGHVEDLADLDLLEDLGDGVELLGRREVGEVAGVDQEIGPLRQGVDPGHGLLERGGHGLLVRVLAEPDVAVADLDKREAARPRLSSVLAEGPGRKDPAACCPQDAGACPRHAFEEPATIHPVALVIAFALIRHYRDSPCANFGADFDPGRTLRERRRPLALDTPEWPRQMTWQKDFAKAVMEAA